MRGRSSPIIPLEVLSWRSRKSSKCAPPLVYQYDLFSVVNHDGQLNTGHYTNFARSHDEVRPRCCFKKDLCVHSALQWYRFDDDKSVHVCLDSRSITNAFVQSDKSKTKRVPRFHSLHVLLC